MKEACTVDILFDNVILLYSNTVTMIAPNSRARKGKKEKRELKGGVWRNLRRVGGEC